MSKSRKIGTGYENHVQEEYLQDVWPEVERAPLKGVNDYGDFVNVGGWLIEAKKRKKLQGEIIGWVKTAIDKTRVAVYKGLRDKYPDMTYAQAKDIAHKGAPWAIICAGDKRGQPDIDLAILPAYHLKRLLIASDEAKYGQQPPKLKGQLVRPQASPE